MPAMAVADAVCRMVPGVLADPECFEDESHCNGLLEYPQYSRPAVWHGRAVPEILLSGNHEKVRRWRRKQAHSAAPGRGGRTCMHSWIYRQKQDKEVARRKWRRKTDAIKLETLKTLDRRRVTASSFSAARA